MSTTEDDNAAPSQTTKDVNKCRNSIDILSMDYDFNAKLLSFADMITDDDLEKMKFLISGERGTPKRILETIVKPIHLMKHLNHRGLLNKHNLLHLQALVWTTKNAKLHKEIVKFSRHYREQPLHFFPENTDIGEDQENIRFHIQGGSINREDLEQLRSVVATYLCIPEKHVVLTGLTPFKSIVVTFAVPKQAVSVPFDLSSTQKNALQDLKVDMIVIGQQKLVLTGNSFEKAMPLSEAEEMKRIQLNMSALEKERDTALRQLSERDKLIHERPEREVKGKSFEMSTEFDKAVKIKSRQVEMDSLLKNYDTVCIKVMKQEELINKLKTENTHLRNIATNTEGRSFQVILD